MAFEAVIYPQDQFSGGNWKECDNALQENHDKSFCGFLEDNIDQQAGMHGNWDLHYNSSSSSVMHTNSIKDQWGPHSLPEACTLGEFGSHVMVLPPTVMTTTKTTTSGGRRKRRRTKSGKSKEELENQRMTHIAIERNRRKQMNEYLAVIRSLMPASYVQRGDQASIIGGAINFVKELEQNLQTLESQKINDHQEQLFSNFFTFPQYSIHSMANETAMADQNRSAFADIQVTVVESHAKLKILSKRRPRQLLKVVAGLQCFWLTILHLNVTTAHQMVLYTLSLKLEDGCQITTVDEIADAVNGMLGRIEEEAAFS